MKTILSNYKLFSVFFLSLMFLVSCSDMLDLNPENGISPDQINADNIPLFLNGLYRRAIPNRDIYVIGDMRGGNYTWTALSGSNSNYGKMVTGMGIDDTFGYSNTIWDSNYKIIYDANNIIQAADKLIESNTGNATALKMTKAESLFFRAMAYYQLVISFGDVPIFLTTETENIPRDPKEKVYQQILSDLDFAITNTNNHAKTGFKRISNHAAKAYKARVLLQMGKKSEAAALAKEVINTSGLKLDGDYGRIFRNTGSSTEIIFAFANLKNETNLRMSSLFWPYGTIWAGSYFVQPTEEVIEELYTENDIRKDINILKITNSDGTYNTIVSKYWDVQPLILLRLSEMYLICAEGLSQSEGLIYLNEIRSLRGENKLTIEDFNSADKVIDEVLKERRKELFSEGFLYQDYVRTSKASLLENTKTENDILLPIPGRQINLSEGVLIQNPY